MQCGTRALHDRPRSAAVGHHYGMGDYALPDEVLNELAAVGDDVVRVFNYADLVGGGALLLRQSTFYRMFCNFKP